ncbi:Flp family type IVb pilin [Sneathiella sp.]|jgi:Flp pilus assembly pilin Flp|uniref:Flp family type IVb pilin n=1 Tax=Sneathiella sp. TaxID=1964365 RepID=UPI0039E701B2
MNFIKNFYKCESGVTSVEYALLAAAAAAVVGTAGSAFYGRVSEAMGNIQFGGGAGGGASSGD